MQHIAKVWMNLVLIKQPNVSPPNISPSKDPICCPPPSLTLYQMQLGGFNLGSGDSAANVISYEGIRVGEITFETELSSSYL